TMLMRSAAPPAEIASAARGIFHDLAPDAPVKFSTFTQEMGGWLADRRFLLLLVGVFAATALVLAAVGIYGVVAFSVTRRTQEIGIRMSLGAQRGNILSLVLGEGARMAAFGVVIGIGASLAVTRLMSSLLFGVSATDPLTFAGVAILLSGVALLASYIPARRAMHVDPLVALRYERGKNENAPARFSLRHAHAAEEPRLHSRSSSDPCPRHRREHRHLYRAPC